MATAPNAPVGLAATTANRAESSRRQWVQPRLRRLAAADATTGIDPGPEILILLS